MPGKGPVLLNWFKQCQLANYIRLCNGPRSAWMEPCWQQISCLSRHSLFCISWVHGYFSSKIFLELTLAVSVYMEKEFKFLLWPVARPHSVASQVVLLCNNGNIWQFYHTDTELSIVFHSLLGDSLFNSFISLCQSLGSAGWSPPVQSCWFYSHWVVLVWVSALAPQLWERRQMTARGTLQWTGGSTQSLPSFPPLSLCMQLLCFSLSAQHQGHQKSCLIWGSSECVKWIPAPQSAHAFCPSTRFSTWLSLLNTFEDTHLSSVSPLLSWSSQYIKIPLSSQVPF